MKSFVNETIIFTKRAVTLITMLNFRAVNTQNKAVIDRWPPVISSPGIDYKQRKKNVLSLENKYLHLHNILVFLNFWNGYYKIY